MSLAESFNALQARLSSSPTHDIVLDWAEFAAHKQAVSASVIREASAPQAWTIDEVKSKVAERLGVPIESMHAKGNRFALPVLARRLAIYIGRQRTNATADELANAFGYRNHSSAFEAMGKIETLRGRDTRIDELLEELNR